MTALDINTEFRSIISHALLGCDTNDVPRETWELVFSECQKYAQSLTKELQAENETLEKEISLTESQLIAAQSRIEYLDSENERLKGLIYRIEKAWHQQFYQTTTSMSESQIEKQFSDRWQQFKTSNNIEG